MTGKWGTIAQRFERHYIPEPNSGCWLWLGATNSRGYGGISVEGRNRSAHRVSFEIHNICELSSSVSVCHRCDNPSCVNPDHLFLGTHQENMKDRAAKGRSRGPLGEANAMTKLSVEQVRAIRRDRRSLSKIAAQFGLSISGVHGIRTGATWRHVR